MQHSRRRASIGQLAQQVVLGIALAGLGAAVQDRRLVAIGGKPQVAPQVGELVLARGEAAVVVQTGLAKRHDQRVERELDDGRPGGLGSGRDVRMDAD